MAVNVKNKLEQFIKNKKLTQTFSLFQKVGEEFNLVNDVSFGIQKDRENNYIDRPEVLKKKILQIGLDTEYQFNEKTGKNDILSYQLYFPAYKFGVIFYTDPKNHERFTLEQFIQMSDIVFNNNSIFKEIDIVSHFSVAEINSFAKYKDFVKDNGFENNLNMIQKSFTTVSAMNYKYISTSNHTKKIKVNISDTWLMSGKSSLKSITSTDEFKIKKVEVTKSQIENMKTLLKDDKKLYDNYSIIDAYLTVEYYNKYYVTLKNLFDIDERILTASSISAKLFKKEFKDECDELLGVYPITIKKKMPNGKFQTLTVKRFHKCVSFLKDSYYGGRNETYCAGVSRNSEWGDYDLKSAYPTALLIMQDIDWEQKIGINGWNWDKIEFNDVGIVTLKFKFKDSVMMPAFPIKDESTGGLVFVREGETTIPLQELYMALKNNMLDLSNTHIITGYKFLRKETRKISEFVTGLIKNRNIYKKNTQENGFYKLVNNALYGKFTQGVDQKSVLDYFNSCPDDEMDFNYSDIQHNKQRQSSIYQPGIAAFITASIRAMVTEQMNYIESQGWAKVISVTTDGYMLNRQLTECELDILNQLPFTKQVSVIREHLLQEKGVLELKHVSSDEGQNIAVKTRCYWMDDVKAKQSNNYDKTLISRGGAQSQGSKDKDMDYMTMLLATASNDTRITINQLSNSIDMLAGKDLIKKTSERMFNMDYDLKRLPNLESATNEELTYKDKETGEVKKTERIKFNTLPFKNYKEYLNIRQNYITFMSTANVKAINKLRTVEEMSKFIEYNELRKMNIKVFKNQDNYMKILVKSFIVFYMIKFQLKPTDLNIIKIAEMLNINNKQIHNMLRNKMFQNFALEYKHISRITPAQYYKYEEYIQYLFEKTDPKLKEEFVTLITTKIHKPIYVVKSMTQILNIESIDNSNVNDNEIFNDDLPDIDYNNYIEEYIA